MSKLYIFICYFSILVLSEKEKKLLSQEERNLIKCCFYSLDCCDMKPTNFEVKAVLTKCHKSESGFEKKSNMITVRKVRSQVDDDLNEELNNCIKKMKISVKIRNQGLTNCKNQYILIDHVFDSVTGKKQKLFMPYILKIIQQPIMETYGLRYESMVNAEAKETVYNKNTPGYGGCDAAISSCEPVEYKNQIVPYSSGFCCSCKSQENERKLSATLPPSMLSYIPSNYFNMTNMNPMGQYNEGIGGSNIHIRGNQDCDDKYSPPYVNSEAYHASSHCLNYSSIWYLVYRLQRPMIRHRLAFQIFQKYQTLEVGCKWKDLTKKVPMVMGTDVQSCINTENSIIAHYAATDVSEVNFGLNYKFHKLLIPDITNVEDLENHPEAKGGPEEYLVVKSNKIQSNGKLCDVAGVGYEAFAKQPNRCGTPSGSCLKNQPLHMWEEDKAKDKKGKKGEYFLKYFGALPDEPITPSEGDNKSLCFFFTKTHTSTLQIEFKDDENSILRSSSLAIITEVYIDSTDTKKTTIISKIFNANLVSSVFYVALAECPLSLPASFSHITSKPILIPPQHQHIFKMDILCPLNEQSFFCSLLVLNTEKELIAVRKIRFERSDRCICIWHCGCVCFGDDNNLKCDALSLLAYHAAGFQGGMPVALQIVEYSFTDYLISMMLYIILTLCLTLLLMGLVKALLGICIVSVGLWGLDIVLDLPRKINKYYEKEINHRRVSYNERGWPIHPDTGVKVRNIPLQAEFCINVVFFIIYPFCVLYTFAKRGNFNLGGSRDIDSCYCKGGKSVKRKNSSLQNTLSKNK